MAKIIPLLLSLIVFFACSNPSSPSKSDLPTQPPIKNADTTGISIYLLKDPLLVMYNVESLSVCSIQVADTPWLAKTDVDFYDISANMIYLKQPLAFPRSNVPVQGLPFILFADSTPCFLGAFWSAYSSIWPTSPIIMGTPRWYPDDILCIETNPIPTSACSLMTLSLIASGKYHAGIACTIDSVKYIRQGGTRSVRYSFTILNKDSDNLYLFDPDKMGSTLFHYFTNGIYFHPPGTFYPSYWASNNHDTSLTPLNTWDINWHTLVASQDTMKRTVTVDGFDSIPSGTYACYFTFPSCRSVEKIDRYPANGRIWMGEVYSSEDTISIY